MQDNNEKISIIVFLDEKRRKNCPSQNSIYLHNLANITVIEHMINTTKQIKPEKFICFYTGNPNDIHRQAKKKFENTVFYQQKSTISESLQYALSLLNSQIKSVLICKNITPMLKKESLEKIELKIGQKNIEAVLLRAENQMANVFAIKIETCKRILGEISRKKDEKQNNFKNLLAKVQGCNNKSVITIETHETMEVDSLATLALCEKLMQQRLRQNLLENGVTMTSPETVFVSADTTIGQGTHIEPYVVFAKGVKIGENCLIRSFCHIEGVELGNDCTIGPYARLRQGTKTQDKVKIGNFVETKNVELSYGVKANHLTYLGDSIIGAQTNIGAGTITCNYDGQKKHQTIIAEKVFLGSNTSIVAPVRIGKKAKIGAGSVITQDVPPETLALTRAELKTKKIKTTK